MGGCGSKGGLSGGLRERPPLSLPLASPEPALHPPLTVTIWDTRPEPLRAPRPVTFTGRDTHPDRLGDPSPNMETPLDAFRTARAPHPPHLWEPPCPLTFTSLDSGLAAVVLSCRTWGE